MQKQIATALVAILFGALPAQAAHHWKRHVQRLYPIDGICNTSEGEWRSVCHRTCPDVYSCNSLYGAYGPYGGTTYWGAYSRRGDFQ
jgi:hypothetical protein